ncbi:P-loop containing nucleoside triphosphate hydrolase protein [Zychaea mexicana]|uniref:P-loop containing nucleoside triphosphate hydrolase protein n=1 Tax=Zychaea mexicana TaxID=64656 RepID=UPI0022FDFCC2|nr:P-loop containing nucleoside triphosphate hydrolase protein [Zychaea mexicana]KAI9499025.1 P-loop containing nucleoside triphosphate hydrolase protein [Zychaea mexicana]
MGLLSGLFDRSGNMRPETKKYAADVAVFALSQVAFYFAFKWIVSSLDPNKAKRQEAKSKSSKVLGKLGVKDLKLSEYEQIIAAEVVHADELSVTFREIGGLDHIVQDLRESVIYPLCYPELFTSASGLLGAPKGVLLYGPPGCGKTMLAKALAKESNATFINLHVSTLTDKYYGESNKLVAALFSLARKLQPSIVFIDEIDSFLRERRSTDHETTGMMKAEFMSMWDGLTTGEDSRIVVLGATNRPNDIDSAILRRMPKRFAVRLPSEAQRRSILELLLHDINLAPNFNISELVQRTADCSGSDLKELCRNAAMIPIREYVRSVQREGDTAGLSSDNLLNIDTSNINIRPLTVEDFYSYDETNAKTYAYTQGEKAHIPQQENLD